MWTPILDTCFVSDSFHALESAEFIKKISSRFGSSCTESDVKNRHLYAFVNLLIKRKLFQIKAEDFMGVRDPAHDHQYAYDACQALGNLIHGFKISR